MSVSPAASRTTRIFQLTALVLVLVAVIQVGWWVFDQRAFTSAKHAQLLRAYEAQAGAASALLAAGVPEARVRELLPAVTVTAGQASVEPQAIAALAREERSRLNQYVWESAFFLLALCACIGVIWRALHAERAVLKEQDNFLALVSHQFKTPLASLQLSLETMAMRQLADEQRRTLTDRMLSDLARMEAMVSQILDSARLERGRVDFKREPVGLASAVARVVGQFEERARSDRIAISTEVPREVQVLADPLSVDVVVRNLLENAMAAVASVGGGTITLTARQLDGEVELAVRDSGIGFRPADRTRLFQKFSRLHPGGGGSYYGTGLGLFIVSRLMQLAGGRVSARSEGLGRGAEFVLAWPAARSEAA